MNYKKEAAMAALPTIQPGMRVGLGAGSTIGYLAEALASNSSLVNSLELVSSSKDTIRLLNQYHLNTTAIGELDQINLYFDGCDQVDSQLNAFKSGGGIHTQEKLLASMSNEFIILTESSKFITILDNTYPFTIEVLPDAVKKVTSQVNKLFHTATVLIRKENDKNFLTERNNLLIDLRFQLLPPLHELDLVKMIPGVLDHSLFYKMANRAIIAGPAGIERIAR